jgi:hypothetical protein
MQRGRSGETPLRSLSSQHWEEGQGEEGKREEGTRGQEEGKRRRRESGKMHRLCASNA